MNTALTSLKTKQSGELFYTPYENRLPLNPLPFPFPSATQKKETVYYPESDGKPMADNTKQFNWIVKIKEGFELLFAEDPDIFVAGDLLWYPVEGNNKIRAAPDAMIVFGRPKGDRGSYRNWDEENINPQIVFEILSPGNTKKEMAGKLEFYERYGVEEYYIYDPDRIVFSVYIRSGMKLHFMKSAQGWVSPCLNVRFEISNQELKIFDPNGREFISPLEMALERDSALIKQQQAETKAKAEHQRAEQLADKLRELGIVVE